MKVFATILLIAMMCARQAPGKTVPKELNIFIGGWDGPSCSIVLSNATLWFKSGGGSPLLDDIQAEPIEPTPQQWSAFRETLDSMGVWSWKTNYIDWNVLDGTQWTFEVTYDDVSLHTTGSNSYPGGEGIEMTALFMKFIEAIEALIDGKIFR